MNSCSGGSDGAIAEFLTNTERKIAELTFAVVTQLTDLADPIYSVLTRLSLQDLLPERKLDTGLRFGYGGDGGLPSDSSCRSKYLGTATAARMPRMTSTDMISIRVKPRR